MKLQQGFRSKRVYSFISHRVLTLLLVLAMLLSISTSIYAKNERKKVRVGWYPYTSIQDGTNSENLSGYNYEFLHKISLYTNWEYEFVFAPWEDCERMLCDGSIDILGYLSKTEEREKMYQFSSYDSGLSTLYLVTNETHEFYEDDLSCYNGAVVATIPSSFRSQELESLENEKNISFKKAEFKTQEECFQALDRGDVDLVLASSSIYFSGYRVVYRLHERPFYFAVANGRDDLLLELNNALRSIYTANPDYDKELFKKYSSQPIQNNELVFSSEEAQFIKNAKPILVAVSEDNYPMSYIGSDGKHHGFIYEYLKILSKKSGLKFKPVHYNGYYKAIQAMSQGKADIILQLSNDFKFIEYNNMDLTQSYLTFQRGLLIKNSSEIKTVAVEKGHRSFDPSVIKENTKILYLEKITDCIDAVEKGLADAAIINLFAYQRATQLYPNSSFSFQVLANGDVNYVIGVSHSANPVLCMLLDKVVGSIDNVKTQQLLASAATIPQKISTWQWIRANQFFVLFIMAIIVGAILFLLVFFEQRLTNMEKNANMVLAEKNKELQKANAAKSDFLSRTSHDLRTPMNAIMGLTALAIDEPSVVEKDFYLSQIFSSSEFLLGLINDVLDMDRIENGSITLDSEPYPYLEFAQMINTMIVPLCQKKNIDFIFESNDFSEVLLVDRTRFNQIFFNLLSNAVKYTPEGGTITFDVTYSIVDAQFADLEFLIADTGIGMTPEFMDHMFEPFSQENRMGDVKGQSSGLGLAIVKSMIDLMGGSIHVESTLHQGSIFLVRLSIPITDSEHSPKQFIDPIDLDRTLKGKKILLVDDQPLNLQVAKKILEKKDIVVTTASDGQNAIDTFVNSKEGDFDAILMDIRMPIMNGLDATRAIRNLPRADAMTIPIIAMTANSFDEDKKDSSEAGMDAHLGKPIVPKELFECLYLQFKK